uniref:Uncharacterized protein n=1 Tax=Medicago truncatula TaxID=3880 RepID=B7FJM2_MEDTR|nr:unknown [Medicago truncatula]
MVSVLVNALFPTLFLTLFLYSHQTKSEDFNSFSNETNFEVSNIAGTCNLFRGKWVYDASYPLYDPSTCPFIDPQFNCQKHGRKDKLYQKYRWMPFSCNMPRFNGLNFLKGNKGKKIMFVGDSLSLNQFNSLACMIHAAVPNSRSTFRQRDAISSVTFEEYGLELFLYRTAYLVDLDHDKEGRVLKLDSIKSGEAWRGMDGVDLSTRGHWWDPHWKLTAMGLYSGE